jgi:glycosyltransferase involved in cell wall biosynthesis
MIPVTVIVPVRNAEMFIDSCLASIARSEPQEIIVVDGLSTDRTLEIASRYPVRIISDDGQGVSAARMMGIEIASCEHIVLIDVDVVLQDDALENLYTEFIAGEYDALQAGLVSTSGPGYWGEALVYHHNNGRSKNWPGLMATLFKKDVLLQNRLDERFRSGEDIEIRWRLSQAGYKIGVSRKTWVSHRFGDTYEFAKDQFIQDGKGLARMVLKYGRSAAYILAVPAAGGVRGILRSIIGFQPRWIPYFLQYFFYNYVAIIRMLREGFPQP